MEKELELFGFYLSKHPVTQYKAKYNSIDVKEVPTYFDKIIDIVLYVENVRNIDTKKGEKMAFITGSDEQENIEIVLFPKNYIEIQKHDILYLKAKVEKRFDKYQLNVYKIVETIR